MTLLTRAKNWLSGAAVHPEARKKRGRYDFLENPFLGYGTSRDKVAQGGFSLGCQLQDYELDALYYGDDISAKIVNLLPDEMFRAGYTLVSKKNPDAAKALQEKGKALKLDAHVKCGLKWGRLRGGALLLKGALDGQVDLTLPLESKKISEVKYLSVIDRRYASVKSWQDNPFLPNFGEPEIYTIGQGQAVVDIHASRVVRFDGVDDTDPFMRRQLGGWTHSFLQRPYDVIRKFATSFDSAAQLMTDASQGVWKIEGLLNAITDDRDTLVTRMALADMSRSAGRAIMVDSETEDFTRVATSFAGVDAILDRFMVRVAAAANQPVSKLFGRAPAGLNATGESETRDWYASVASDQKNILEPVLLEMYEALGQGSLPEDLEIEFSPLWEPTEKEKAETDKIIADTDKIYVELTSVTSGQVAIARFGSGEGKIEIDEAAIKKDIANDIELLLNPPPPPTVTPNGKPEDASGQAPASGPSDAETTPPG